jgi:glutamyl-tRNA(Gln) amidotransferase subunit E
MTKIGIEIHQRLATGTKLFCRCKTDGTGKKQGELKRKLHPVASEMGKIDIAAEFEQLRGRTFNYDLFDDTTCLIDTDEEPPHEINSNAVKIVLVVCKMMQADAFDEIQVMRKTVIDGSNTSGFQRTAMVGTNGRIKTSFGEITVPTICLEEESSGIIGELVGKIEGYRLDRLGIPLIELATSADIKNGKEAREVAEQIGLMLRSTGKVQRGIGTIRQDLNVSIEGGARVEIKGVQELELIEKVIENELSRQKKLIDICGKIKKIKKQELAVNEVTTLMQKTGCKFIREAIGKGKKAFAARMPGLKGILGTELYSGFRYGTELSGYAKTVRLGGIIHSDEDMGKYGFTEEIKEMEKSLEIKGGDAWIMVVGDEGQCKKGMSIVYERAYLTYVPEETRRSDLNGFSLYMRPLPGAERMYPETDIPPFKIDKELLNTIVIPDFEKTKAGLKKVLNDELVEKVLRSEKLELFKRIMERGKRIDPTFIAVTLEDTLKSIKREGLDTARIGEDKLAELFDIYSTAAFVKAAMPEIIRELAKAPGSDISGIINKKGLKRISGFELRELIKNIGAKDVGEVMQKYRLQVDAEEVAGIFKDAKPKEEKEKKEKAPKAKEKKIKKE